METIPTIKLYTKAIQSIEPEPIPDPSMSELWRELPKEVCIIKGQFTGGTTAIYNNRYSKDNPCDALADLLICIKKYRKKLPDVNLTGKKNC